MTPSEHKPARVAYAVLTCHRDPLAPIGLRQPAPTWAISVRPLGDGQAAISNAGPRPTWEEELRERGRADDAIGAGYHRAAPGLDHLTIDLEAHHRLVAQMPSEKQAERAAARAADAIDAWGDAITLAHEAWGRGEYSEPLRRRNLDLLSLLIGDVLLALLAQLAGAVRGWADRMDVDAFCRPRRQDPSSGEPRAAFGGIGHILATGPRGHLGLRSSGGATPVEYKGSLRGGRTSVICRPTRSSTGVAAGQQAVERSIDADRGLAAAATASGLSAVDVVALQVWLGAGPKLADRLFAVREVEARRRWEEAQDPRAHMGGIIIGSQDLVTARARVARMRRENDVAQRPRRAVDTSVGWDADAVDRAHSNPNSPVWAAELRGEAMRALLRHHAAGTAPHTKRAIEIAGQEVSKLAGAIDKARAAAAKQREDDIRSATADLGDDAIRTWMRRVQDGMERELRKPTAMGARALAEGRPDLLVDAAQLQGLIPPRRARSTESRRRTEAADLRAELGIPSQR